MIVRPRLFAFALSLALALSALGCGEPRGAGRVLVLGLDGLDLEVAGHEEPESFETATEGGWRAETETEHPGAQGHGDPKNSPSTVHNRVPY